MNNFAYYGKKLEIFCSCSWLFICFCYRYLLFRLICIIYSFNPFFTYILYFSTLSFVGFGILTAFKPRTTFKPRNIDLLFTSVSATTVSSMSTLEMEIFSNAQLIVMTLLMFMGGEVFTSMLGLHLKSSKNITRWKSEGKIESVESDPSSPPPPPEDSFDDQIHDLNIVTVLDSRLPRFESHHNVWYSPFLKCDSVKFLGYVVLGYLVIIHILGVASVLLYLALVPSAEHVLRNKGLKTLTFVVFTVVSTFASCGFIPTNENMMVFSKKSGLLWILIPPILLGGTLFPWALRLVLWVLGKKIKKEEAEFLLKNTSEAGYLHLLPGLHSVLLVATVFCFILIGFIIMCSLEWSSAALSGLNSYQKVVGVVFQCVNARHTGETIVDLATIAPALLVFFVLMMYLPPYTSFLPTKRDEQSSLGSEIRKKTRKTAAENLVFSQLTYLVIFIILICITERKSMKEDPINFSVFNIIVEVISAYGNVGFTTGYSCERRLKQDPNCVDKWYGLSGRWSDEGKVIMIIVMFFGRLKKFNMNGGRTWKLL